MQWIVKPRAPCLLCSGSKWTWVLLFPTPWISCHGFTMTAVRSAFVLSYISRPPRISLSITMTALMWAPLLVLFLFRCRYCHYHSLYYLSHQYIYYKPRYSSTLCRTCFSCSVCPHLLTSLFYFLLASYFLIQYFCFTILFSAVQPTITTISYTSLYPILTAKIKNCTLCFPVFIGFIYKVLSIISSFSKDSSTQGKTSPTNGSMVGIEKWHFTFW